MLNKLTDITSVEVSEWLVELSKQTESQYEPLIGSSYFLVAETEDGFRFQHDRTFMPAWGYNEDGFAQLHNDCTARAQAEALHLKVMAHLAAGGRLDPEHWAPVQGCYGSAGWDEQAEIALEREEESWA